MLKSFTLKNFKSYQETIIRLSRVTFLVGANASGKSNALEALRFLGWLGQGKRLDEIDREFSSGKPSSRTRGSASDLFRFGTNSFSISASIEAEGDGERNDINWMIEIRKPKRRKNHDAKLVNYSEKAFSGNRTIPLFETVSTPNGLSNVTYASYDNFAKGGNKPRVECANDQAIFYQLLSPSRFPQPKSKEVIPFATKTILDSFANILFLDPDPSAMRDLADISPGTKITENGSNVSSVLQLLCTNPKTKRSVLSLVKSLPEQNLTDIDFVTVRELNKVMLRLEEHFGNGRKVPASLLSDGTLRALAIAAALCGVPEHSIVVIEEIDNGIHPSRARDLVCNIRRIAAERNIQVVITTHNPALMDAIQPDELPDVLCCFRDSGNGTSRIRRLGDLPEFEKLFLADRLGDLTTSGKLEQSVKDTRTAEQFTTQRVEWLKAFLSKSERTEK